METNCVEEFVRRRTEKAEQKRHDKQDLYKKVYDELVRIPLFVGKYDADNGSSSYMNGIASVMEKIAYCAGGDELSDEFETTFLNNMRYSEEHSSSQQKNIIIKHGIVASSVLAFGVSLYFLLRNVKGSK